VYQIYERKKSEVRMNELKKKRRKEINMNTGCVVRITNIRLPRRV
jgi:hypothetical protein